MYIFVTTLHIRIHAPASHTAVIVAVPRNPNVAVLAPPCAPRVLHQPEVGTGRRVRAVAHHQHRMIGVATRARRLVVDAALVERERLQTRLDADGHRADIGHGFHQFAFASCG